jgi:hypothetical protein
MAELRWSTVAEGQNPTGMGDVPELPPADQTAAPSVASLEGIVSGGRPTAGRIVGTPGAPKGRPEGLPFMRDGARSHYRSRLPGPLSDPWDRDPVQTAEPKNGIPSPGDP